MNFTWKLCELKWHYINLKYVNVGCGNPSPLQNGKYSDEAPFPEGATVTYQCKDGFRMVAPSGSVSTCQAGNGERNGILRNIAIDETYYLQQSTGRNGTKQCNFWRLPLHSKIQSLQNKVQQTWNSLSRNIAAMLRPWKIGHDYLDCVRQKIAK